MHLRRLIRSDAADYRAVMLHAYATELDAFTSTVAERESLPIDWWESRICDRPNAPELVFGAFDDKRLIGLAGLMFERRERTSHKATLFGMFVLPEFRGQGVARALVRAALNQASETAGIRVVQLTVTDTNAAAVRLYESCGFGVFGNEPFAVNVGERFVTKLHMWCPVC